MSLGSSLSAARRKHGLSQEEVAEKLGVSRQTISKWETDETVPDIWQSKHLAVLYHVTLDELIEFDPEQKEIERCIAFISEEKQQKRDWTRIWGKKYPVLITYQETVSVEDYAGKIRKLLDSLKSQYRYNDLDAMLVLKDILAHVWNKQN